MTKRKRPNKTQKRHRKAQKGHRSVRERSSKDPTPAEIAEACQEIRDAWTDREHVKRAGGDRPEPFRVPQITYTPHGSFESAEE